MGLKGLRKPVSGWPLTPRYEIEAGGEGGFRFAAGEPVEVFRGEEGVRLGMVVAAGAGAAVDGGAQGHGPGDVVGCGWRRASRVTGENGHIVEENDALDHMFNACTTAQITEFIPEKRGFRIHGHSTTIALERAFWNVLEDMARELGLTLPRLIQRVHDGCLVANDKNIASCLRVICVKWLMIYSQGVAVDSAALLG